MTLRPKLAAMTLVEMHDAVTGVVAAAVDQFTDANPGRLAQLVASSETVLMAVDALFTEIPYRPNS